MFIQSWYLISVIKNFKRDQIPSQVVAKAKASDEDLGDTLTFSISSPYFRIDPKTGTHSVKQAPCECNGNRACRFKDLNYKSMKR